MLCGIYILNVYRGPERLPLVYIGQSKNMVERFKSHICALRVGRHDNVHMLNAFRKYGEPSFHFNPILVCVPNKSIMTLYEQLILDFYRCKVRNAQILNVMKECVDSHLGVKRRPESVEKLKKAITGKKRSPECVMAMTVRLLGRKRPVAECLSISLGKKGKPQNPISLKNLKSPKRVENLRKALCGKPKVHSEETKQKIAISLTGKKQSPELIEKRIASLRGRKSTRVNYHHSDDTKAKITAGLLLKNATRRKSA